MRCDTEEKERRDVKEERKREDVTEKRCERNERKRRSEMKDERQRKNETCKPVTVVTVRELNVFEKKV